VRAQFQERGEFRGEVRLALLGVAEECGTGALEAYHGLRGKAQGRVLVHLDRRAEKPL
jgi:hypothetical protein